MCVCLPVAAAVDSHTLQQTHSEVDVFMDLAFAGTPRVNIIHLGLPPNVYTFYLIGLKFLFILCQSEIFFFLLD